MYEEAKLAFEDKVQADAQVKRDELEANPPEVEEGEEPPEPEEIFIPEFDSQEWYENFDDENPPIDIPDEIEDDVDNDCNIDIKEARDDGDGE
jgi:hypothetical protein